MSDTEIIDQTAPEINEGVSVPGEAAPAPQAQEGGHDSAGDVEARARAMGWRPKDEFNGPEEKWRSAEDFVKKGENDLPVLRERLQATTRKLSEVEAQSQAKLEKIERMAIAALQRQRSDLDAQYQAAMRHAVANADTERYDQLSRDRRAAVQQFDSQIAEAAAPPQQNRTGNPPHVQASVDTWVQQNQWFDKDPMLNSVAIAALTDFEKEAPGRSLDENLKLVSDYVRTKFPEKFGISQRATASAARPGMVEGGSRMSSSAGPRQKGVSDLPADVRKVGEKFVAQGLYKSLAEYAKDYHDQD